MVGLRALILGAVLTACAGTALAGPLAPLEGYKCPQSGGVIDQEAVISRLLMEAKTPMGREVAGAVLNGGLGDLAARRAALADGESFNTLLSLTNTLLIDGPDVKDSNLVVAIAADAPQPSERTIAYLNGPVSWASVQCKPKTDRGGDEGGASPIIIGKSSADLGADSMKKRDFATFSYTADRDEDKDVIEADITIGLALPGSKAEGLWPIRPYLSYQRRTGEKDPLNDLSLGLAWRTFVGSHNDPFTVHLEYLTDDQFESEGYRAEVALERDLDCGRRFGDDSGLLCLVFLAVDHVDIQDPGEKKDLADAPSFTRYGGGLSLVYWRDLKSGLQFRASAAYELREPFDHDDGDAAVGRLKFSLLPSPTSHFEFGIEYEEGEDITSLVRSNTIKAKIGFRR